MKETTKSFICNNITLFLASIFALLAPYFYYTFRIQFVYVDIVMFTGFSMTLWWIMVASCLFTIALACISLYDIKIKEESIVSKNFYPVLCIIALVLTGIFTILNIVTSIVLGKESFPVAMKMMIESLPIFLLIFAVVTLVLFFPKLKEWKSRVIISTILITAMLFSAIVSVYPLYSYKINSAPVVIDNGKDYSVVFTTNDIGTGYVEYNYNGEDYKIYESIDGRLKGDSMIHTFNIPYEHLENNKYRVGTTRVIDELSYGGRLGKSLVSDWYNFKVNKGENQEYLVLSDWHTRLSKAYKTVGNVGNYDAVIMLGDSSPGLMYEEEVVEYILKFGGKLTNGEKPIIYTRGNHETRGKYAINLSSDLGMDKFYYTTTIGNNTFIVLDSGEDKKDNHPEYGGMVNYEQERREMIAWLQNDLPAFNENNNIFVLVHDYKVCLEEELSKTAYEKFNNIGVDYILSGHTHTTEQFTADNINIYLDGGSKNGNYVATKLVIKGSSIELVSYDNKGNIVTPNTRD